jgi:RNA polymerase sigma-70 factor (ECF subfamily)
MRSRSPDLEALEQLFRDEYARIVVVLTAKLGEQGVAEECAQDAYVELVRRWAQISAYRDPAAWLWLVALRKADKARHRRNRTEPAFPSLETADDWDELIDLYDSIRRLPDRQRDVIALHYLADLSVSSIALELGIAEGTVKSQLHDARRVLRGDEHEQPTSKQPR